MQNTWAQSRHSLKTQPNKQAPETPGECAGHTLTHDQGELLQSPTRAVWFQLQQLFPGWSVLRGRAGVAEHPLLTSPWLPDSTAAAFYPVAFTMTTSPSRLEPTRLGKTGGAQVAQAESQCPGFPWCLPRGAGQIITIRRSLWQTFWGLPRDRVPLDSPSHVSA